MIASVSRIEIIGLLVERPEPMWSALHGATRSTSRDDLKRPALLIKLTSTDGHVGWGQSHVSRRGLQGVATLIRDELVPIVLGTDPLRVRETHAEMTRKTYLHGRQGIMRAAIAGIDIALWDLAAQVRQVPLYRLLGGTDNSVPVYASGGFYRNTDSPSRLADEVSGYVAEGFRAVKIKIAGAPIDRDVRRIIASREAVGDDVALMVDANRNYRLEEAQRIGKVLDEVGTAFFEEPLPAEASDDLKQLQETTATPTAGFETVTTVGEYRWLLREELIDVVQPDVIWSGGITDSLAIAQLATERGLPVAPHAISSALSLAANLHFAAAIPNTMYVEMDRTQSPLSMDLVAAAPTLSTDGSATLPASNGLGVAPVADFVERHKVLHLDERHT